MPNAKPEKDPWRFIKSIMETGENLAENDPDFDKEYNIFQINTLLSRHLDTLAYAHQMNLEVLRKIPPRYHYQCLMGMVPKRRRWAKKFPKAKVDDAVLSAVSEYTQENLDRSREYLRFLNADQIKTIVRGVSDSE